MSNLTIHSREEWHARDPRLRTPQELHDIKEFFVHWPGGDPRSWKHVNTVAEIKQTLRSFQDYHMDHNGWSDIGYTYLLAPERGKIQTSDTLWRARGPHWVPASQLNHNSGTVSVCVLMGPDDNLTEATKRRLRSLHRHVEKIAGRNVAWRGHCEVFGTECPGPALFNYIKDLR